MSEKTASQALLHGEFEKTWLEELKPVGVIEGEYARSFIHATWLKQRVAAAQDQILSSTPAGTLAALPEAEARSFERLHKLEESYARRAARALRELQRLQAERRAGGGGGKKPGPRQPSRKGGLELIPDGPSKLIH